jgi:Amino-terminal Zinc-binding domain of ubiquitin ligase E3A
MEPNDTHGEALFNLTTLDIIPDGSAYKHEQEATAHLQYLIRAFTTQILYGCLGPACHTPTCLTYGQRENKVSFRRPHPLTARFQAQVLATEPNAEQLLCHNPPVLPWWSLNLEQPLIATTAPLDEGSKLQIQPLNPTVFTPKTSQSIEANHSTINKSSSHRNQLAKFALLDFWKTSLPFLGEIRYDRKSLSQCLLQTKAMKSLEWSFLQPKYLAYRIKHAEDTGSSIGFFTMKAPSHSNSGLNGEEYNESQFIHAAISRDLKLHLPNFIHYDHSGVFKNPHNRVNIKNFIALKTLSKRIQRLHAIAGRSGTWEMSAPSLWKVVSDTLQHILTSPNEALHLHMINNNTLAHCDLLLMAFDWRKITPNPILSHLQKALRSLCNPPNSLINNSSKRKYGAFVENNSALLICSLCVYALVASNGNIVEQGSDEDVTRIDEIYLSNEEWISRHARAFNYRKRYDVTSDGLDGFDHEPAVNLASLLVRVIAKRTAFDELKNANSQTQTRTFLENFVLRLSQLNPSREGEKHSGKLLQVWITWLDVLFRKFWNSNWILNRWDTAGAAAEHLNTLFKMAPHCKNNLPSNFILVGPKLVYEWLDLQFDFKDVVSYHNYIKLPSDPNKVHLLRMSRLLSWSTATRAFRVINVLRAMDSHNSNEYLNLMMHWFDQVTKAVHKNNSLFDLLIKKLRVSISSHLQVRISRDTMLEDTFTQFWGREFREMIKPLKVIFSNEKGTDLGGLSNEFFHLAFRDALDPKTGRLHFSSPNAIHC